MSGDWDRLPHPISSGFPVYIPFSQSVLAYSRTSLNPDILPSGQIIYWNAKCYFIINSSSCIFNDNSTKPTSFSPFELAQLFSNWMILKTVVLITTVSTFNLTLIHHQRHWVCIEFPKLKQHFYTVTYEAALWFTNHAGWQNSYTFRMHPHGSKQLY